MHRILLAPTVKGDEYFTNKLFTLANLRMRYGSHSQLSSLSNSTWQNLTTCQLDKMGVRLQDAGVQQKKKANEALVPLDLIVLWWRQTLNIFLQYIFTNCDWCFILFFIFIFCDQCFKGNRALTRNQWSGTDSTEKSEKSSLTWNLFVFVFPVF